MFEQMQQVQPPAGMTVEQFVSGALGTLVPFLTQLVRNHLIQLNGRVALLASVLIAVAVTALGYVQLDPTPTLGEFLTNAALCFGTSQVLYNALEKGRVSRLTNAAVGLPGNLAEASAKSDGLEEVKGKAPES